MAVDYGSVDFGQSAEVGNSFAAVRDDPDDACCDGDASFSACLMRLLHVSLFAEEMKWINEINGGNELMLEIVRDLRK